MCLLKQRLFDLFPVLAGKEKFLKKYNQAGTMAAHGGLDPHDNNKWEKKAENYAEKNIDKWMKKLKKA